MKVTYIGHSGFLVETGIANLLFDYSKGELPEVDPKLPFLVFVSHVHQDHYNPKIFELAKKYPNVQYFLSNDIELSEEDMEEYKLSKSFVNRKITSVPAGLKRIITLSASEENNNYIIMETIKSTDQGLAFLLNVDGKNIFHAGDLNCWVWEGQNKQQFNNMQSMYKRTMELLHEREIYLAFAPLDPRQGRFYKMSMDYLLNAAPITYAVPMHLWEQYEYIDKYEEERQTKELPTKIIKFTKNLESVEL